MHMLWDADTFECHSLAQLQAGLFASFRGTLRLLHWRSLRDLVTDCREIVRPGLKRAGGPQETYLCPERQLDCFADLQQ